MNHKSDSFLTVFTLELFLGREKVKKSKQNNAPSSSSFIKLFTDIITKLLVPSGEPRLHPRGHFVVLVITTPCYFMIFDEIQIWRLGEAHLHYFLPRPIGRLLRS